MFTDSFLPRWGSHWTSRAHLGTLLSWRKIVIVAFFGNGKWCLTCSTRNSFVKFCWRTRICCISWFRSLIEFFKVDHCSGNLRIIYFFFLLRLRFKKFWFDFWNISKHFLSNFLFFLLSCFFNSLFFLFFLRFLFSKCLQKAVITVAVELSHHIHFLFFFCFFLSSLLFLLSHEKPSAGALWWS